MPKVSVIIPTHNRPELLLRALASVYAQTFQDFEVIVVDDGESPRAKSVLEDYLQKPNFIYVETGKNQGGAVTRNVGAANAKGEFLAFLDDDDEWLPHKLALQVRAFDDSSDATLLVFNGVQAVDAVGQEKYWRLPGHTGEYCPLERTLSKCFIWTSSVMIKGEAFVSVGGFDELLTKNQEWDLELRLLQKGNFYAIDEALTIIHIGESEQMGSVKNLSNIIKGTERLLEKHENLYKQYPQAYAKRLFHLGCLHAQARELQKARVCWQKARVCWQKALTYKPFYIVAMKHWLTSFVPPLYRILHRNVV